MAKCRDCALLDWRPGCTLGGGDDFNTYVDFEDDSDCPSWSKRETPLLVDELAEALAPILKIIKQNWFIIGMLPGSLNEQWKAAEWLVIQGHAALAKHQKEVGDARA